MNNDKLILGIALSAILVVYTAIVFQFFGSEGDTRIIYLSLIGLPLALGFFMAPRAGLIVLGILIYSIDWISEAWGVIPREGTWLIDIILLMFVARVVLTSPWRTARVNRIEMWIYAAILFSIVSSVANGNNLVTFFIGFRVAFKYMLLYIAVYHLDLPARWVRGYIKFLFGIALLQPLAVLWQWKFTSWTFADDLSGTFGHGQTPGVALFLLALLTLLIAKGLEQRHLKSSYFFILCWFLIAPILGEAKFFFLILPPLILFMLRADFFKRPATAILISIIGVVMMVSVDFVIRESGYWIEGRNPLTYITRLPEVYQKDMESTAEDTPRRIFRLISASRLAAASPKDFLVGNGPGAITLSFVAGGHSKVKSYFARWTLNSTAPTIAWLLIEYGYLGTVIMLIPVLLIYRRGKFLRQSDREEMRFYGRWLEGLTFLYGFWMLYTATMQIDGMSYIFWATAALLVRLSYAEEARMAMEATLKRAEEAKQSERVPESIEASAG